MLCIATQRKGAPARDELCTSSVKGATVLLRDLLLLGHAPEHARNVPRGAELSFIATTTRLYNGHSAQKACRQYEPRIVAQDRSQYVTR